MTILSDCFRHWNTFWSECAYSVLPLWVSDQNLFQYLKHSSGSIRLKLNMGVKTKTRGVGKLPATISDHGRLSWERCNTDPTTRLIQAMCPKIIMLIVIWLIVFLARCGRTVTLENSLFFNAWSAFWSCDYGRCVGRWLISKTIITTWIIIVVLNNNDLITMKKLFF